MTVYSELIQTTSGPGKMLVDSTYGDPRGIKFEVGVPTSGTNVIGTMRIGTWRLEAQSWRNVTDRWIGCDLSLGSADGSNEVGVMNLVLDNNDGSLSPINNPLNGPGTLVRMSTWQYLSSTVKLKAANLGAGNFTSPTSSHGWPNVSGGTYNFPIGTGQTYIIPNQTTDLTNSEFVIQTASFPAYTGTANVKFKVYNPTSGKEISYTRNATSTTCAVFSNDGGTRSNVGGFTDTWWRIRHSGTTIYVDTSADGITWTNRASDAATTIDVSSVWVQIETNATTTQFAATSGWKIAGVNHGITGTGTDATVGYSWVPFFTGVAESWTVSSPSIDGLSDCTIVVPETTAVLARINDVALASVVGSGDTTGARVKRLLDASNWPYGLVTGSGSTTYTHQSTDMSANRLTELYLTADSSDLAFRCLPTGEAYIGSRVSHTTSIYAVETIADGTLQIANDGDLVTNSVALAIANDPAGETTYSNAASISQFGRRSTSRDDLNLTIGTSTATIGAAMLARGSKILRPVSFDVSNDNPDGDDLLMSNLLRPLTVLTISMYGIAGVPAGVSFTDYYVAQVQHTLRPMGSADIEWSATVALLPSEF